MAGEKTTNYPWIDEYLCAKTGVIKDYKPEWAATRYQLGGKMFAMMGGDKQGEPIITFKLPPEHGRFLREQYPGEIVPGYYMNKEHWNSLYLLRSVPQAEARDMLDRSYGCMLASLSKKTRESLGLQP